ncbi:MAG: FG-GAP repeat protein, partial [Planctomycetes bacterium]|nr:FG-GAP repeat protein [Planctomycetota bacterium]
MKDLRIFIIGFCTLGLTIASLAQIVCEGVRLAASDSEPFESFGFSVAVLGDTALIGAEWDREIWTEAGAAYIFRLVPFGEPRSGWVEAQKLLASDGAGWNHFGHAIAMDGGIALIGAGGHLHDDNSGTGSAYVFRYNGATWVEEQELLASDGAWQDNFGTSVSISGDVAVIGAPLHDDNGANSGSAYIFRYDGSTWLEEQKLLASDGAGGDGFGSSVAVFGDTVIVGAGGDDNKQGINAGSAYVFRFDPDGPGSWTQQQKLLAFDTAVVGSFGISVSISGDAAVIGTLVSDNRSAAYVFRFDGESSQWLPEQKLVPSDGSAGDQFGRSVAIDGDTAVIGAWAGDANGPYTGPAYVFRYSGSRWVEKQQLLPEPNPWTAFFGWSVAIDGDTAVIGAHGEDHQAGAVYVFDLAACLCPADLDGDGSVGIL